MAITPPKYMLTDETMNWKGYKLHRIKAIKSFGPNGSIKQGELGGWVESENNLSQNDRSWIFGEAKVYGGSKISENAKVKDDAEIIGSEIKGYAKVGGKSFIKNSTIRGLSYIAGNANITDSDVYGTSVIYENAKISRGRVKNCTLKYDSSLKDTNVYGKGNRFKKPIKLMDEEVFNGEIVVF